MRIINENERNFKEDRALGKVIAMIKNQYGFSKVLKVCLHSWIGGLECDSIVYFSTENGVVRTVEIEFKERDVSKLVRQLLMRRELFNYQYGVVYLELNYVVNYMMERNYLKSLFDNGVGLIVFDENGTHHLLKSKFRKSGLEKWAK